MWRLVPKSAMLSPFSFNYFAYHVSMDPVFNLHILQSLVFSIRKFLFHRLPEALLNFLYYMLFFFAHVCNCHVAAVMKDVLTYKIVSVHSALSSHKENELILFLFIIIAYDKLPKMHIEWSEYTHLELLICIALIVPSNHNSCCWFSS